MNKRAGCVIVLVIICVLGIGIRFVSISKRDESKNEYSINWNMRWQGLLYEGTYTGELKDGLPYGTGVFEGARYINDNKIEEIIYSGKWNKGYFSGNGSLTNKNSNIVYSGKFYKGYLNKEIKIEDKNSDNYVVGSYKKDVPIGVFTKYSSSGIVSYDCYVSGLSLNDIENQAKEYTYEELMFNDDLLYKRIRLDCTVVEKYIPEDSLIWNIKVKDKADNYYVLKYTAGHYDVPRNYMPQLKNNDKISVIGYVLEKDSYDSDGKLYPCIDALCTDEVLNINKTGKLPEQSYDSFVDYPYYYQGMEIRLKGYFESIMKITENDIYFAVISDTYSKGYQNRYLCMMENNEENQNLLKNKGEDMVIEGDFCVSQKSPQNHLMLDEKKFYPLLKIHNVKFVERGESND